MYCDDYFVIALNYYSIGMRSAVVCRYNFIMTQATRQSHSTLAPALYVVATPIGNLQDITLRALDILRQVDLIAAEDTRHSGQLLKHYGVSQKMQAVHEHNEHKVAQSLVDLVGQGQSVALITDAGTPAISDPGATLVDAMLTAGLQVIPVPGASAVTAAMSVAGIQQTGYQFHGFLPAASKSRVSIFNRYLHCTHSLIFYEAPHRIMASLQDAERVFGAQQPILLARELTKQFETLYRASIAEVLSTLNLHPQQQRGEFVLIILPQAQAGDAVDSDWPAVLSKLMAELPLKQAVKLCAEITGAKKNEVYSYALKMKND